MNNKKIKRPSMKNLVRVGKIWWEKINELYVKCIPYNIKEKVEEKPNEGDRMTNEQLTEVMKPMLNEIVKPMFDQIMKRMNDGFAEVKVEIEDIKSQMKEAKADREEMKIEIKGMKVEIKGIKESLVNLTEIVKKNHPKDFE